MPHLRPRHLENLLKQSLKYSSIVGVFGHRQVGKTTLVNQFGNSYVTFDSTELLANASAAPEMFLRNHASMPLIIDECQYCPPLFPTMKEWVRVNKKPGQLLLAGSVRFSSRKAIRESLTGRLIAWELLPMDLAEIHQKALHDFLPRILAAKNISIPLKPSSYVSAASIDKYIKNGGLPGIFYVRESSIQLQKLETQINTILERDIRLVTQTTLPYRILKRFLTALANRVGQPIEILDLSRETHISAPSIRNLLSALESIFVIRMVPTEGHFAKPVLFFEDLAEARFLAQDFWTDEVAWTSFVYQNLRTQVHYRPEFGAQLFQFRSKLGHVVPICFRSKNQVVGIVPVTKDYDMDQGMRTFRAFKKSYPTAKLFFVDRSQRDDILADGLRWLGVNKII